MKHTPGPWILEQQITGDITVIGNDGVRLALVTVADYPRQAPNARLIAAAPELLEALKAVLGFIDQPITRRLRAENSILDADLKAIENLSIESITKAEGK